MNTQAVLTLIQLDKINPFSLSVLKNKELIDYNQDPVVGPPAKLYKLGNGMDRGWKWNETMPGEFWSGDSSRGKHVFVLNVLETSQTKRVEFKEVPGLDVGQHVQYRVWDMWNHKYIPGKFNTGISFRLGRHDMAAFLLEPVKTGKPKIN